MKLMRHVVSHVVECHIIKIQEGMRLGVGNTMQRPLDPYR
jgi:hypothetical protein